MTTALTIPQDQSQKLQTMSINNYAPTVVVSALAIEEVRRVLVHYITLSAMDNVPTKEPIIFIADNIVETYPNLEIGELHIAMKNGILGVYGPLFNKISIDNPLTWIKNYYEITWPMICQKAENKNKMAKLEDEKRKYVPVPKELAEKTDHLINRLKLEKRKYVPPVRTIYASIEQFFIKNKYQDQYQPYMALFIQLSLENKPNDIQERLWMQNCKNNHLAYLNIYGDEILRLINGLVKLITK